MIIIMSPEVNIIKDGRSMARQYDEAVFIYNKALSFADEARITFVGHASTRTFGEQAVEAKEFAEFLIQHGLEKNKPVSIDLLGCEIGYCGPGMDVESYAHKVYQELQSKDYTNVTVNAFINFINKETLLDQRVIISCEMYQDDDEDQGYELFRVEIYGIREKDLQKIQNDSRLIALNKQREEIISEIKLKENILMNEHERVESNIICILKEESFQPLPREPHVTYRTRIPIPGLDEKCTEESIYQYIKNNRHDKEKLIMMMASLNSPESEITYVLNENKNNLKKIDREINDIKGEFRVRLFVTNDFRQTFDENAKYQINSLTCNDVNLSLPARMAIIILNDRIAELREELRSMADSKLDYFFSGGDTKKMKISLLEKVINDVRITPENELAQLIGRTVQNKQLATARTGTALEEIRGEMSKLEQAMQMRK